ncbi:type II secretion pathway component [Idiomarina xiamenensis]|uniref:Type II secretory pathway component n=1 Tax=Idiomarina xiamenensis 10-D-4 TaxID=740709 RepID=K2KSL0_9GAMM|nr:type II secretion pathway component [Idiomarina xiamenensis]EKE85409.1 Type II secretory pathway component [Idiomarina xiamenensis 10-D-4]
MFKRLALLLSIAASLIATPLAAQEHDPTRPLDLPASTAAEQPLEVQIIKSGSRPSAVISGQLVRPGDTIQGYTVVAINTQQVSLSRAGERIELSVYSSVKNSVKGNEE